VPVNRRRRPDQRYTDSKNCASFTRADEPAVFKPRGDWSTQPALSQRLR